MNGKYVSLHSYIRNTLSDTEVHAEHQLRVPVCRGKEYIDPCKTQENERTRGKARSVSRTGPALRGWGNWSKGLIPTGAIVWVRGETFKAECETADLWQPKWNELFLKLFLKAKMSNANRPLSLWWWNVHLGNQRWENRGFGCVGYSGIW